MRMAKWGFWQAEGIEVQYGLHFHAVCNLMLVLGARCSVLSAERQVRFQS